VRPTTQRFPPKPRLAVWTSHRCSIHTLFCRFFYCFSTVFNRHQEISMTPTVSTSTLAGATRPSAVWAARSVLLPLLSAAALSLTVLYGVAFAHSPLAHNAAHDVRHITVKPCH
jgi:cobalt transporter subunit CbtB